MQYLDQYVEALKFLTRFNDSYRKQEPDFQAIRNELLELQGDRRRDTYIKVARLIQDLVADYARGIPAEHRSSRPHALLLGFWETFQQNGFGKTFALNITAGNLFFRGEPIYQQSKTGLKKRLSQGAHPDLPAGVHVWLTLEDMTVIDPTLLGDLEQRGLLKASDYSANGILVWRDEQPGDFRYEPLLVDNDFAWRIDDLTEVSAP